MADPTTPTDDITRRLVGLIRAGNDYHVAAKGVGIETGTFDGWMERGGKGGRKPYTEFRRKILGARADGEDELIRVMREAALDGKWQAAAWLLERGYDWIRMSVNADPKAKDDPKPEVGSPGDPFGDLDNVVRMNCKGNEAQGG